MALATLSALRQENAGLWNWLATPGARPEIVSRRATGQTLVTTMEDGSLVLGTIELKQRRLSLSVNSLARAERGRAMLTPVLAGLVGAPLAERTDLDQMLASKRQPPAPTGLSPEQERALVRQTLDDHYRRMLDEPIPALGGNSPRAAARTAKGRQRVVAWLKLLENHAAQRQPGDTLGGYDLSWMWRELGVEALRL
jgi:hypothetical protein